MADARKGSTVLVAHALLALGATVALMLGFARDAAVLLSWFTLWVLAPALVVLAVALALRGRAVPLAATVALALPLWFGPFVYGSMLLGRPEAQDALVFAAVPLWQLLALAPAGAVAAWLVWRAGR